jgi:hypothetical protein
LEFVRNFDRNNTLNGPKIYSKAYQLRLHVDLVFLLTPNCSLSPYFLSSFLFPQSQQLPSIIIPVRSADKRMNMALCRLRIEQKDPTMIIKLQTNDGTLNTIVERIFISIPSDPGEICVAEMFFDLCQTGGKDGIRKYLVKGANYREKGG